MGQDDSEELRNAMHKKVGDVPAAGLEIWPFLRETIHERLKDSLEGFAG